MMYLPQKTATCTHTARWLLLLVKLKLSINDPMPFLIVLYIDWVYPHWEDNSTHCPVPFGRIIIVVALPLLTRRGGIGAWAMRMTGGGLCYLSVCLSVYLSGALDC